MTTAEKAKARNFHYCISLIDIQRPKEKSWFGSNTATI
jgi:hypothetical protein